MSSYFCNSNVSTDHGLFKAVRKGDLVTAERLLKNGADPNQRHVLGWTLLQTAAIQCNVNMIKILLKVISTIVPTIVLFY